MSHSSRGDWLIAAIENNRILTAVRNGMVLALPAIVTGCVALVLQSLPIEGYQEFLSGLANGTVVSVLSLVQNATLGIISLIMLLTISYSYGREQGDGVLGGITPFVALAAYIAFAIQQDRMFTFEIFQSTWLFNAILVAVLASVLFIKLCGWMGQRWRTYTDGTELNGIIAAIFPAGAVILLFALLNVAMVNLFGVPNFQTLFSDWLAALFNGMGRGLISGLVFVFSLHFMWFFGVHGGNVLDGVAKGVFETGMDINVQQVLAGQVPTEIMTKTFLDTFVLFGGCGTLLALVIAILIHERRKNVLRLTRLAAVPVLFNINELMVFGLPVVLNPIYVVPFILTPLVLTAVSYLATVLGWVPVAAHGVRWTTPLFLSGYAATGSIAGSLLQLFNLAIGVLIYTPFVKLSQRRALRQAKRDVEALTNLVLEEESRGERVALFERPGRIGSMAKSLAADLEHLVRTKGVTLYYQPQVDTSGRMVGGEALLRWEHPVGGWIAPPLIIRLAEEGGFLSTLEDQVMEYTFRDTAKITSRHPVMISFNLTARQLDRPDIVERIERLQRKYSVPMEYMGLELTEQTALTSTPEMTERLTTLHDLGIQIIMDDFGMGHSSMMYLQDNRFDVVKLDGSLVRSLADNTRSQDIISSILYLAESLKFKVVAEFVETPEQRCTLERLGCDLYQGYLYSPAVPLEKFMGFLKNCDFEL
ncbi:PTS sugar transporter subunit IIC/EAL domain-containing protein [Gehongia tenuis]